jgi:hypothetical protein
VGARENERSRGACGTGRWIISCLPVLGLDGTAPFQLLARGARQLTSCSVERFA